jgi:uncharacterized protein YecT (DUF1311 family)
MSCRPPKDNAEGKIDIMKWTSVFATLLVSLLVLVGPIYAQTQAEMNATAREDFARADADLNKTYQAVLAKLPDAESKQKLKEKQRAWMASRDAEAARATNEANGGSMAPMLRYEALTHLTRERIKELEAMLNHGTASGPKSAASESESKQASSVSEAAPTAAPTPYSISPDKKWEYKLVDGSPSIVEAGTANVVFNLSEGVAVPEASEVIWSPNSKRFAFNYQAGTRYQTSELYQFDGNEWQELDSPESDATAAARDRSMTAQKKKLKLSPDRPGRPIMASYLTRKWIDSNTALLYVHKAETFQIKGETEEVSAAFFFTLKFDPDGKWKIVRTTDLQARGGLNKVEKEESDKLDKEPGETSTIGEHIYHHQP